MLSFAPNRPISLPVPVAAALRLLPLLPLQLLLQGMLVSIARRRPKIHERLNTIHGRCIGIDPSDLPFAMLLEPRRNAIALRVVRQLHRGSVATHIRGPILALMGLVNGTFDGDALFFSRDITIEGDIEAAMALRNAIDDAQIDWPDEVASCLAPWAAPLHQAAQSLLAGCLAVVARHRPIVR